MSASGPWPPRARFASKSKTSAAGYPPASPSSFSSRSSAGAPIAQAWASASAARESRPTAAPLTSATCPEKAASSPSISPWPLEHARWEMKRGAPDDRCDARPHYAAQLGRGGGDGEEGGGREARGVREHPPGAAVDLPLAGEAAGRERSAGAPQDPAAAVPAVEGEDHRAASVRCAGGHRDPGGAGAQGVPGLDRGGDRLGFQTGEAHDAVRPVPERVHYGTHQRSLEQGRPAHHSRAVRIHGPN